MTQKNVLASPFKPIIVYIFKLLRPSGTWKAAGLISLLISLIANSAIAIGELPDSARDLTDLDIQELMEIKISTVYGASKYEQKLTEAPASVSIITSSDIQQYGYRTLADILRSVRGFYTTYDRNYHYLGIRGVSRPGDYNSRYLLLVDGHRINDSIYDSAAIGTEFPVDVDLIDRVEVIRGPSSSIYGTNAFLGVINVLTKKGNQFKGAEISGEAGSYDTYKARLSYGNRFSNGMEAVLSGSAYDSKGPKDLYFREFDSPATNNGIAQSADADSSYKMFTNLRFKNLSLQGVYSTRDKTIPTAPWGTEFNNAATETRDDFGYLDLKYEHDFNAWKITSRVFYDYYKYLGTYMFPGEMVNKDGANGERWGTDLKLTCTYFKKHHLILGGEFIDSFRQDQLTYNGNPYVSFLDDKRTSQNWAFYIQDEFRIIDALLLNIGVRYDYYSTFGDTINPRAALIYKPFPTTAFKFIYGSAFRAPTAFELYYSDGNISTKSNPELKPETIDTYEFVYEQYLESQLRLTAVLFSNTIKNMISLERDPSDGLDVYRNVDCLDTRGAELELEKQWNSGWIGLISYTFQKTENRQTGEKATNSPQHLIKGVLTIPLWKDKLSAGLEELYSSERKLLDGTETGSSFITNITLLSRNLIRDFELSASIYNVFNTGYSDPASREHVQSAIEQDGRSFRLKLTYRF
ncbi:MAG: TonB-dependent receptor [Smithella sp.]